MHALKDTTQRQKIRGDGGRVVAWINVESISRAWCLPEKKVSEDMFILADEEYFRMHGDWCMNCITKNWLKSEKGDKSQLPAKLKRMHFKDEIAEIIVLLHHVVGSVCTDSFEF